MGKLMTRAAYARRIGKSKQYVGRLAQEGRITLVRGKIDPDVTDPELKANTDPTWVPNIGGGRPRRDGKPPRTSSKRHPPQIVQPGEDVGQQSVSSGKNKISFLQAKTAKATFNAKTAELDYKDRIEKLREADEISVVFTEAITVVSSGLDGLADRVADQLSIMTDKAEIRELLFKECRMLRKEMVGDLNKYVDGGSRP